jgi:molecular chaperone GrpE
VKQAREFAISAFAKDLVESVDNLDRALGTVSLEKLNVKEKNDDLQELANFHEGLKMTETILMQTLAKHGLSRLDPEGEKFNPNEHEATFMAPQPDKEDNTVFHVQQKGFKLNGRTLRAAKVGVVKNK